jgi:hypothetical protein
MECKDDKEVIKDIFGNLSYYKYLDYDLYQFLTISIETIKNDQELIYYFYSIQHDFDELKYNLNVKKFENEQLK